MQGIRASGGWQTAGEFPNWVNEGIGTFFGSDCLELIKNLNLDSFRLFIPSLGPKSLQSTPAVQLKLSLSSN